MILGSLEEQGGFENRVFQIWSSSRNQREIESKFAEYGEELEGARNRYEKVKAMDRAIFDG